MNRINPFPGLRPFGVEESHLFFGRDQPTNELLRKLGTNRFIAVVGTSGSGKSSLVRAGMLPDLHGGLMTSAGSSWRVAVFRPGNAPIRALAEALSVPDVLGSRGDDDAALQTAITETVLRRGAKGLVDAALQAKMAADENLLVVVDQFEELFRFKSLRSNMNAADEAAAFVKLLLEASNQDAAPIYVVLTMRSGFLGDCTQFRDLPEAINAGQYLIPRMTRDQRQAALIGPVAVGGARMTPRLIQRLLNDVGDNPDQLPILQHAMMRTWDNWVHQDLPDAPIDIPHYEATGGMAEALSRHADEVYSELPDDDSRRLVEKIFKRLTEKGTDNRELRFPAPVAELCAITGADEQHVIDVVEAFRLEGRWFLMPPPEVPLTSSSLIDISHESLIRIWHRLQRWVIEEAESARVYKRLAETSTLYREHQAGLWRNPDLQIALQWRECNSPTESWARRYMPGFNDAMTFLNKSKTASRRRRIMTLAPFVLIPVLLAGMSVGTVKRELKAEEYAKQEAVLAKDEAEAELDQNVRALNEVSEADIEEQLIQEQLVLTMKKIEFLEGLGVEDPGFKNDLLKTVGKLAAIGKLKEGGQEAPQTNYFTDLAAMETAQTSAANLEPNTVESAADGSATIKAEPDFVTCNDVIQLQPMGVGNEFPPGRVYVFARVRAPKPESLTLKWYNGAGEELWTRQLKVSRNVATGYRTYAWKTLPEAGRYEVRLYNDNQVEIARRQFTISQTLRKRS